MPGEQLTGGKPFISIVRGVLAQKVDESTPGAKRRDYELKDGTKGTKWELNYKSWSGILRDWRVIQTEYGENLNLEFDDAIVSVGLESRYFADLVKKYASADPLKSISISPYDFETDQGKRRAGVNVFQGDEKLKDYFYDFDTKKYKHGFPEPEEGTNSSDDWKVYFIQVKKFLKNWIETHPINTIGIVDPDEVEEEKNQVDIDLAKVPY